MKEATSLGKIREIGNCQCVRFSGERLGVKQCEQCERKNLATGG